MSDRIFGNLLLSLVLEGYLRDELNFGLQFVSSHQHRLIRYIDTKGICNLVVGGENERCTVGTIGGKDEGGWREDMAVLENWGKRRCLVGAGGRSASGREE